MSKKFATFISLVGVIALGSFTLTARSGPSASAASVSKSAVRQVVVVGRRMTAAQKVNYDLEVQTVSKLARLSD